MTTFADLAARGSLLLNDGYRTKASELGTPGFPVLRVAEIADGAIAPSYGDHVRCEYRDKIAYKLSRTGDVLLTTKGTVGRRAIMPDLSTEFAYSPQLCFFRVLDSSVDNRWLYYWLGSSDFWNQARSVSQQTDMAPYISLRDLRAIEIELPPIQEQRTIAATLGALDDKVESNRRAATLELALAATMLNSGTERIRVGDGAVLDKGLSYKGAGLDDGSATHAIPMINLANFTTSGALKPDALKYYTGDFKPRHRLAAWDLVVANTDLTQSREILGRGFLVPTTLQGALHTHHTSVFRFRERSELAPFLWARLQSAEFRARAKAFATGTTVTALPREALLDFDFLVPSDPEPTLAAARALIEHSWQLVAESAALKATRDTLLPDLLSGRIRVQETSEVVQDVTR